MLAVENLRKGSKYYIKNNGDSCNFEVLEFAGASDYRIKNLESLEVTTLAEFLHWGIGSDFELYELEN